RSTARALRASATICSTAVSVISVYLSSGYASSCQSCSFTASVTFSSSRSHQSRTPAAYGPSPSTGHRPHPTRCPRAASPANATSLLLLNAVPCLDVQSPQRTTSTPVPGGHCTGYRSALLGSDLVEPEPVHDRARPALGA